MSKKIDVILSRHDNNMGQLAVAMTNAKLDPHSIPDEVRRFFASLAIKGIVIAADVAEDRKPKKERKPRKERKSKDAPADTTEE